MLRAKQQLLYHNTNNLLLTIRQFEVDYFQHMYNTFGVLGAVVSGFAVNSIAQVVADTAPVSYVWKAMFWLWTTCAIGFSTHVMITTALITVYGPGLALRGPIGSMKKAVDGMYYEQGIILFSTVAAIFCLSMELLTIFVIEMFIEEAWASSILFIVSMFFWYKSCMRIYNNFKIPDLQDNVRESWVPTKGEAKMADYTYVPPSAAKIRAKTGGADNEAGSGSHIHASGSSHDGNTQDIEQLRGGLIDSSSSVKTTKTEDRHFHRSKSGPVASTDKGTATSKGKSQSAGRNGSSPQLGDGQPANTSVDDVPVYCEGYLIMQAKEPPHTLAGSALKLLTRHSDWDRKYFVLNGYSLWYYNDRYAYDNNSDQPCILRPILVQYYRCDAVAQGAAVINPPFAFQLVPNNDMITATGIDANMSGHGNLFKKWVFRCDTFTEMKDWIDVMNDAAALAPRITEHEVLNPIIPLRKEKIVL